MLVPRAGRLMPCPRAGPDGHRRERRRLDEFTRLISSNLLEAELRAAFARENLLF